MTSYQEINITTIKHIKRNGNQFSVYTEKEVAHTVNKTLPVYSHRQASNTIKRVANESKTFQSLQTKQVEEIVNVTKEYAQKLHTLMINSGIKFFQQNMDKNVWILSVI